MKNSLEKIFLTLSLLFFISPIILLILMSFSQNEYLIFPPDSLSFQWYSNFFHEPSWLHSIFQSLLIAFFSAIYATFVSIVISLILLRISVKFRNIVLFTIFIPLIIPLVVMGAGLLLFLSDLRLVDTYLGIILSHSLISTPFAFIAIFPNLSNISSMYEFPSRNLGANFFQTVSFIYLPLLRHNIVIGFLIAFLSSLNEVVFILFLTGKNIVPLSFKIWEGFRYEVNPTINVAAIFLLFIALLIIVANYYLSQRKDVL